MDNQTLKLTQEQVQSEVDHINMLANNMQTAIDELDQAIQSCMARGLETGWARTELEKLRNEQRGKVTEAIANIKLQANKLLEISSNTVSFSEQSR